MNPKTRGRAGAAFLALIVLATLFLMIDVTIADSSAMRDSRYAWHVGENQTVFYSLERARPGDVVTARYDHWVRDPVVRYDFLVTEPAEAERIGHGDEPQAERIYYQTEGITPDTCCFRDPLHITRPEPPAGEPGERLALVWIYHHAEGVSAPEDPEEREAFRDRIIAAAGGSDTAETLPAWAILAHRLLMGGAIAAGVGAVAAAILWSTRRGPVVASPRKGQETEALVTLVAAGRDHLRTLRGFLLAALAFLVLTGSVVLSFFFVYLEDLVAPPSPGWHGTIRISLLLIWGVLVLAVGVTLVRVQKTLTRWETHLAEDPLGL